MFKRKNKHVKNSRRPLGEVSNTNIVKKDHHHEKPNSKSITPSLIGENKENVQDFSVIRDTQSKFYIKILPRNIDFQKGFFLNICR